MTLASLWGVFVRFVSPIAVIIAFLHTIGWLSFGAAEEPPSPAPSPPAIEQPMPGAARPDAAPASTEE